MTSMQTRKQRKALYQAPLHKKRKWMGSHLEESLLLKYDRRSMPVVKGDTVKVMRGSFRGHEDKVAAVRVKKQILEIEGLTMAKADGNRIPRPVHPSNVLITKLNLTDSWRREILQRGVSEETRKAIEKEAQQQLKEKQEEEQRRAEQQKRQEEEEKAAQERSEQDHEETSHTVDEVIEPVETEQQPPEKDDAEKDAEEKPLAAGKKTAPSPSDVASKTAKKPSTAKKTTTKTSVKEEKE